MSDNSNKNIGITDKQLIIFLVSRQFKIQGVKKDPNGTKSILYFENTKELNQAILDYANRVGNVNVADYLAVEKRVNNLLYFNKARVN